MVVRNDPTALGWCSHILPWLVSHILPLAGVLTSHITDVYYQPHDHISSHQAANSLYETASR